MRRLATFVVLIILWLLHCDAPAWAWGRLGHRVISKLAERHLSDRARAEIEALLEPGESLADCSTWADEHRREFPRTAAWHYVDVPLDATRYDDRFAADDPRMGFIVPKIRELRLILKDRSRSPEERRFALRFLVHLVEDLHQPLHVGEHRDRGGNALQVRFFRRGTNLHHLWDSLILEYASHDEDAWFAELVAMDRPLDRSLALRGTVGGWATESLQAARQAYQDPATGWWIEPGATLGEAYIEANLPLATRQLYRAGARLAWVLEDALGSE
jgi:hypothetical protein